VLGELGLLPDGAQSTSDIIFRALTLDRDLSGARMCSGLMPNRRKLVLELGSHKREVPFKAGEGEYWPGVQADMHRQYRAIRADSLDTKTTTPVDHYLKVLDFWKDQHNADWQLFVPDDLPKEQPVKHETTRLDDFNRANGPIGSSSEGWSWTYVAGSYNISGNTAIPASSAHNNCRAEGTLSSADHYAQANATLGSGNDVGVIVRFDSSAETCYVLLNEGTNDRIYKIVAGAYTSLFSTAQGTPGGAVMYLEVNGSSLQAKRAGSNTASGTDTAITGGVRGGLRSYYNASGNILDNFEAADLGGGATTVTAGNVTHSYTAIAPKVQVKVAPAQVTHSYTGQAPKVQSRVMPAQVTHTYTGVAPQAKARVAPAAATHSYTGRVPALSGASVVGAQTAAHSYTAPAPQVRARVTAGQVTHSYTAQAPKVQARVMPAQVTHTYTARTPVFLGANVVGAETAAHSYTPQAPKVQRKVAPAQVTHSYTAQAPKMQARVMPAVVTHSYTARVPTLPSSAASVYSGGNARIGINNDPVDQGRIGTNALSKTGRAGPQVLRGYKGRIGS
jgi:hypothetical protein